jgi:DNA-binding MarR family transcriptional regulator
MTDTSREPDEARLAAWRAFLNAHAAVVRRIERDMAAAGALPLGWYDVLVALAEAPGHRLRMHELADAVVLSRSGLTRLVDRLEAAGLLVRERSAEDKRGAFAVLTPHGHATQIASWPAYAQGILDHFARYLDDAEAATLTTALERVYGAVGSASQGQ